MTFSPLPCWEHLSPEAYRERVGKMGLEIEEEAAVIRKRTGAHPLGAAKILAQHPWTRPERVKKSPAPLLRNTSLFPVWRRTLSGCRLLAGAP